MRWFVSYTESDLAWAKWVAFDVENFVDNSVCDYQERNYGRGDFMALMRESLTEADAVVAILSQEYLDSAYCQRELNAALRAKRDILLPVRIDECALDPILDGVIRADLAKKTRDAAQTELRNKVSAFLGLKVDPGTGRRETERPPFPGERIDDSARKASPRAAARVVTLPRTNHRAVFVAPKVGGLSPRRQFREMTKAMRRSSRKASLPFKPIYDATTSSIIEVLNKERPTIFHLSGKQNGGSILIRTPQGTLTSIKDQALAGLLTTLDREIELAVIDTCQSLRCARAIAEVLPFAIGVEGDIYEDDAITFFSTFYQSLAAGKSLADAVAKAQARLRFERVPRRDIPRLIHGPSSDPRSFVCSPK